MDLRVHELTCVSNETPLIFSEAMIIY